MGLGWVNDQQPDAGRQEQLVSVDDECALNGAEDSLGSG
jgi:hypothetical protein